MNFKYYRKLKTFMFVRTKIILSGIIFNIRLQIKAYLVNNAENRTNNKIIGKRPIYEITDKKVLFLTEAMLRY